MTKRGGKVRCPWPGADALMRAYHDSEWGVPVRDDRALFEHLCLDGAQAGLSWRTILHKRENYRQAFDGFDPQKMARYTPRKITKLLADPGIVRHRLKVAAFITNAQAYLATQHDVASFGEYLWSFVGGATIHNRWRSLKDLPATSPQSDAMSRALKQRGFKFVGPTICYAFMQAVGMVNDHLVGCYRHAELGG